MGSNPIRNLQAIFNPRFPEKLQQIFPARLKSVPFMINFERRAKKILKNVLSVC